MKEQELCLKIRRISIIKGPGTDQICFNVPNDKVLDKVLGNTEARELFPELNFNLQITRNKGEELIKALGLTVDETITTTHNYC